MRNQFQKSTRLQQNNPNGIASFSPGLRGTSYPGLSKTIFINPEGVVSGICNFCCNPVGVVISSSRFTQGGSCLATLGWMMKPRWGFQLETFISRPPLPEFFLKGVLK